MSDMLSESYQNGIYWAAIHAEQQRERTAVMEAEMLAGKYSIAVFLRPRLFIDGDKWCALYGENLQDGVAGFGDTPEQAFNDFNTAFATKLARR